MDWPNTPRGGVRKKPGVKGCPDKQLSAPPKGNSQIDPGAKRNKKEVGEKRIFAFGVLSG